MDKDDLHFKKTFWATPTKAQLVVLEDAYRYKISQSYGIVPAKPKPWDFTSKEDADLAAGNTYIVKAVGGPSPWGGAGGVAYQLVHKDTGHRYHTKFVQQLGVKTGHHITDRLPDPLKTKIDGFTIESQHVLRLAVRIAEMCVFDFLPPCVSQKDIITRTR